MSNKKRFQDCSETHEKAISFEILKDKEGRATRIKIRKRWRDAVSVNEQQEAVSRLQKEIYILWGCTGFDGFDEVSKAGGGFSLAS